MEEKILSKIFLDVYCDFFSLDDDFNIHKINLDNYPHLESQLIDYIRHFIGFKLNFDYSQYFREIKKYFKNVIANANSFDFNIIIGFLDQYSGKFYEQIGKRPYSEIFIDMAKNLYSDDPCRGIIENVGKSYYIGRLSRKEDDEIPPIYISDIDELNTTLQTYVSDVLSTDTFYNSFFPSMSKREAISYLFEWVVRNATVKDLSDINAYFKKCDNFITDTTLQPLRIPHSVGRFLGNDLYVFLKKANVNYETPYYLSFILQNENEYLEMPNIRLGIQTKDGIKSAHILATQSSQSNNDTKMNVTIDSIIKKMLGKSKYFREFNPSHIFSIILTFGILKGVDIEEVNITDYFPLRYQRLVLENQKNDDELDNLQYRLTNKNLNTYLRVLEYFKGIEIKSYPDLQEGLSLKLGNSIFSENTFLQKIYQIGYTVGTQINLSCKTK